MDPNLITGDLIINKGFKEHDEIQGKISNLNFSKGLKTILSGAWTYEKLAKNASTILNISYPDAYRLGVDKLISLVD